MKTGIIILAAGNSSRMGKPKQLLAYKGETLLGIVTKAALESACKPIVMVLGAYAAEISAQHQFHELNYVFNDQWETGMSSSIAAGLSAILTLSKDLEQVLIAVSDQPFINAELFDSLIREQEESEKGIVASSYQETIGTPVLFTKKYFPKLLSLEGNQGAKKLLNQYPEDCSSITFELGNIDIDTPTDYHNLNLQR